MSIFFREYSVTPETRSGRQYMPKYISGGRGGGVAGSGGAPIGSYANLLTTNTFAEAQTFSKGLTTNQINYFTLGARFGTSGAGITVDYDTTNSWLRIGGRVRIEGNLDVQGTIDRYSQTELNIGDTFINLGSAQTVNADGGIRIYGATSTLLSTFRYAVADSRWKLDKGVDITGDTKITGKLGINATPTFDIHAVTSTMPINTTRTVFYISDLSSADVAFNFNTGASLGVANSTVQLSTSVANFKITTGLTDRFYINTLGRIGINTTSPSYLLDINGTMRAVGAAYFDAALYPNNIIGSQTWASGFTGTGWRVDAAGNAYVKSLEVREGMRVFTMQVEKLDVIGGSKLLTDGIEVTRVVVGTYLGYPHYEVYYSNANRPYNVFAVNDVVRCQQWNGTTEIKYYQAIVTGVYLNYTTTENMFTIWAGSATNWAGTGIPAAGDSIAKVSGSVMELSSRDDGFIQIANGITNASHSFAPQFRIGNVEGVTLSGGLRAGSGFGFLTKYLILDEAGAVISAWNFDTQKLWNGGTIGSANAGIELNAANKYMGINYNTANYIKTYFTSPTDWGINGVVGGSSYFRLGNENKIAGFTFDNSKLSSTYFTINASGAYDASMGNVMMKLFKNDTGQIPIIAFNDPSASDFTDRMWIYGGVKNSTPNGIRSRGGFDIGNDAGGDINITTFTGSVNGGMYLGATCNYGYTSSLKLQSSGGDASYIELKANVIKLLKYDSTNLKLNLAGLPTHNSGLSSGDLFTQTATQLGGSGTTKVLCIV